MKHIVIIGNGIAGITAARNIRKLSDSKITVVGSESKHFFSRTALMYIFMGHMKFEHTKPYEDWFWEKNKIELVHDYVNRIDPENNLIRLEKGGSMQYDTLVLASGSATNKFGWPGQDLNGVHGLYSLQDLEAIEKSSVYTKHAVITGGGLIGVEFAEMLHSRGIEVTFLVRESAYWQNVLPLEEAELVSRHLEEHGINVSYNTELKEIIGDSNGNVIGVIANDGSSIECQIVGLTAGVHPNIGLTDGTSIESNRGILVNEYLQTNIENIFAIGDCAEVKNPLPGRKPIEAVWYVGRMMGETLAHTITGNKTSYKPGYWFNSAKFFDIEYQTYGNVGPVLLENEDQFYWEEESGRKCLKIVFDKETLVIRGINVFGIRLRHDVCDQWLKDRKKVAYVVEHFYEASFDPEFYQSLDTQIRKSFNTSFSQHRSDNGDKKGFSVTSLSL